MWSYLSLCHAKFKCKWWNILKCGIFFKFKHCPESVHEGSADKFFLLVSFLIFLFFLVLLLFQVLFYDFFLFSSSSSLSLLCLPFNFKMILITGILVVSVHQNLWNKIKLQLNWTFRSWYSSVWEYIWF